MEVYDNGTCDLWCHNSWHSLPLSYPLDGKVLVPGSLTTLFIIVFRSYSRLLAFEASRILFRLGCDVRVFDPAGLPVKDDVQQNHPKVQELRELSRWSDGHIWISPEQHGNLVRFNFHPSEQLFPFHNTDLTLQRPQYLKTRSIGFRSRWARCAQLKDGPLLSHRFRGVRSPLMQ